MFLMELLPGFYSQPMVLSGPSRTFAVRWGREKGRLHVGNFCELSLKVTCSLFAYIHMARIYFNDISNSKGNTTFMLYA